MNGDRRNLRGRQPGVLNGARVVMLVPNSIRGDPRVCREADALSEAGYDVHLFGLDIPTDAPAHPLRHPLPIEVVRPSTFFDQLSSASHRPRLGLALRRANSRLIGFARHVRALRVLLLTRLQVRALMQHVPAVLALRPDIVHGHDLAGGLAATLIAAKAQAKCVYDIHELYPEMGCFPRWYGAAVRRCECRIVRSSHGLITVSGGIRDVVERRYGRIPDLVLNSPDAPIATFSSHDGPCRALYHGGLIPGRNILELPRWAKCAYSAYGITLTILGFGPLRNSLAAAIKHAEAEAYCILQDPVPPSSLVDFSSKYDVGLIPFDSSSLNNQLCLPNKFFEYMASALAIVSNKELREVATCLEEDETGITFNIENPQGYKNAMAHFQSRPILEGLRRNSRAAAIGKYSWSASSARLLGMYERLRTLPTPEACLSHLTQEEPEPRFNVA